MNNMCIKNITSILRKLQLTKGTFIRWIAMTSLLGGCMTLFALLYLDQYTWSIANLPKYVPIRQAIIYLNYLGSWQIISSMIASLWICGYLAVVYKPSIATKPEMKSASWTLLFSFVSVIGTGFAVKVLKFLVGRARPWSVVDSTWVSCPLSLSDQFASFPSGHAATAGAIATSLIFVFPKCRWLTLILFTLVAFSRILLGVHYPSDIAAGLTVGIIGAMKASAILAPVEKLGKLRTQIPRRLLWS